MDIGAYLRGRKEHLGQESRQVKDFAVFDFNYIPEQPLMREECQTLIDAMLRFDISGIPTHWAVIGSRGSGKTLNAQVSPTDHPEPDPPAGRLRELPAP